MVDITNQDIFNAVNNLTGEVKEFRKTLFGEDGMGGITRVAIDLQSCVNGNPDNPDDNGLVGDMKYMKNQIDGNGREGLKSRVTIIEKSQKRWNVGLSIAQLTTWILGFLFGIKG